MSGWLHSSLRMGWQFTALLLATGTLTVVAGCGGGSSSTGGGGGSSPTITSVSVSCTPSTILITQTSTCTPTVTGTGNYSSSVAWSVSPAGIGSVSSAGVFTPAAAGTATIIATSTEDTTKSGNGSITAANTTALAISITDLPAGTPGAVTVTDPNGNKTQVTASEIITAIPGSYTVAAAAVSVGSSTYIAKLLTQTVTVVSGSPTAITVDYYNVIPQTTKVLDSTGIQGLQISSDGTTLTINGASTVAQSLEAGDVLVVPSTAPGGVAPQGMLRKVTAVNIGSSTIIVTVQAAALAEAFQRLAIQINNEPGAPAVQAVHTIPGVVFHPGARLQPHPLAHSLSTAQSGVTYTLTPNISGQGTVTSADGEINCTDGTGSCSASYPAGTSVQLTATASSGWTFSSWSSAAYPSTCGGGNPCTVTMTQNLAPTATFAQNQGGVTYTLTPNISGQGTVTSADGEIDCTNGSGSCSASYPAGTSVQLTATASSGWTFSGWSSAAYPSTCGGGNPCTVTMTQNLAPTATFANSAQDPCGNFTLGVFDTTQPISLDPVSGVTLSGQVELCAGVDFSLDIVGDGFLNLQPQLNSLTATATIGEFSDLTLQGEYQLGLFDPSPITLATLDLEPIPVPGLPIWVTPDVSVFVGANGTISTGFSTEVSEAGSITRGVSYSSGQWTPVQPTPSLLFSYTPPVLDASLQAKAYAGSDLGLYIYDVVGPDFEPDGYLAFNADITASPWWTLTGGVEGPMSLDVGFLGYNLANYDLGTMFDYSTVIAQASGPFSPTVSSPAILSLSPSQVAAGSAAFSLGVLGSNFVPGAIVTFGATALNTAWQNSGTLTAYVPATLVAQVGTIPVTVMNPGAGTSSTVNFTVTTQTITVTVNPSTAQVPLNGVLQFAATVANTSNTAVNWSVNGAAGGNATVGTISGTGLYTAPAAVPSPATVTVTATSEADSSVSASASVTITTLSYSFSALMYPGFSTFAYGINGSGEVVGLYGPNQSAESGDHGSGGFSYASGAYSMIEYPGTVDFQACGTFAAQGSQGTAAYDINDNGQIVGSYQNCSDNDQAYGFLYDGVSFSSISYPGAASTYLSGINNNGDIVGSYSSSSSHGFLYNGGGFSSLDFPGATSTYAYGINDSGQIVGAYVDSSGNEHAFLYSAGTFSAMDYPGATGTGASGINNSGQIVGSYDDSSFTGHGFLYAGGTFTSIDYPGATGGFTAASGINDNGQIVGTYAPLANDLDLSGFLATPNQ